MNYLRSLGNQVSVRIEPDAEDISEENVLSRQASAISRSRPAPLEFEHKPRGAFGIGISMKVKSSTPHPISYYREKNSK
jgi:hypothetical protein